jgi:hypothetical protein
VVAVAAVQARTVDANKTAQAAAAAHMLEKHSKLQLANIIQFV